MFKLGFKIHWAKTLYLNFRLLPIRQALHLPFLIYGKTKLKSLDGRVQFNCSVKFGLIQLGKFLDGLPSSSLTSILTINDTLVINGPVIIAGGASLTVWRGQFEIGKYCTIGSGVTIRCYNGITIGDYTRVVGGCVIMDTNVHYTKNTLTGAVSRISKPIIIGKYCWINMGTVISKGTVIPDHVIVARNSYLSKDYSMFCKPASFLAGSPAIVKGDNIQRIFSIDVERELNTYFENSDENYCFLENGIVEDGDGVHEMFSIL